MSARHEPTPEFRAFLETEVASAVRREARSSSWATRNARRFRTPVLMVTAFLVGAAAASLPAQVQDAKQRETLTATSRVEEQLAATRLDLARAAFEDARRKFEVGLIPPTSLAAAEAEVKAMESNLARIRLNQEEIRATAAPPRDELTAPLAGSRDFVSERLQLELRGAQQRVSSLEAALQGVQKRLDVGTAPQMAVLEAQTELSRARGELQVLAGRLDLRREFLKESLPPADVELRVQRMDLTQRLQAARAQQNLAQQRLDQLRRLLDVGRADQLDVKRAELEVLEQRAALQALQRRLEELAARGRGKEQ